MKRNVVERKIMWGDLDSLGIVFYPRYYEWMDASGHLFFESIGLNMGELWRQRGILFGLVETSCRYLKPARYHQKIRILTGIDALDKKKVVLKHSILALEDDVLMTEGFEERICLDASAREEFRAVDFPDDIFKVLQKAKEWEEGDR